MTPKWQRARILVDEIQPYIVGHIVWVMVGAPQTMEGRHPIDNHHITLARAYLINVVEDPFGHARIGAENVELLARDENDFAEDVKLIPWETFLAECRANQKVT